MANTVRPPARIPIGNSTGPETKQTFGVALHIDRDIAASLLATN